MTYLETYTSSLNNSSLSDSITTTAKSVVSNIESRFDFTEPLTGLLLGNVQSGKTGQMLGVISHLADKGYRIFLLLTTDNIDLQRQTYNRVKSALTSFTVLSESDVVLAEASNAIIIGFNIRPDHKITEIAKDKGIDIRLYDIIYKVVEEMEAALKGKLEPEYEEKVLGEAEVRKLFKFSKVGTIAGSYVTSGVIRRGAKARVIRDGVVVIDSTIGSLAREKDQAKEVKQGLECGITIENFNDIKEKDIIEAYELVEIKR